MPHRFRALLGACCLALSCPGQATEPVRTPTAGSVLAVDGTPIAGATVTLLSGAMHGGLDPADLVRTTSDERGRFRAQLLPTRHYLLWAEYATAAGTRFSLPAVRGAGANELRIPIDAKPAPTFLPIGDVAPWAGRGELRAQLRMLGADLVPPTVVSEDGTIPEPPLPDWVAHGEIEVTCNGRFVARSSAMQGVSSPLPPPARLPVRVVDAQGKPIAGASIACLDRRSETPNTRTAELFGGRRTPLATTDADGRAELLLAMDPDLLSHHFAAQMAFVAGKTGHGEQVLGFRQVDFHRHCRPDPTKAPPLQFGLDSAAETTVAIAAPDGAVPAVIGIVRELKLTNSGGAQQSTLDRALVPVHDGKFVVARLDCEPIAIEIPNRLPPVEAADPFRRATIARTLVLPPSRLGDGKPIDLGQLQALRIQVLDPTGGPVAGAALVVSPQSGNSCIQADHAMHAETDNAGRAVLPVLPGKWCVAAVGVDTFVATTVVVATAPEVVRLQLLPLPSMQVRVVDAEGKPVADARFGVRTTQLDYTKGAESELLTSLAANVGRFDLAMTRSDAKGLARIPFLDQPTARLRFVVTNGERSSTEVLLEANTGPIDVVVR